VENRLNSDNESIQELFQRTFEVNPEDAVNIFVENFKEDQKVVAIIGSLRESKEFNLKVIDKLDDVLFFNFFFQIPNFLKDDKDVALKCVNKFAMTFKFISERLKGDKDLALIMAKKAPNLSREITGQLGKDTRYIPIQELEPYLESLVLKEELEQKLATDKNIARKAKI
jgi:hypothetical protein